MTLSVCFLVKNKAQRLEHSLGSIKGFADEIIVVDTGSTDSTKTVALQAGAKVIAHKWHDDYADAKNAALAVASGSWILFLKAGETLAEVDKEKILKKMQQKDVAGYVLERRMYTSNKDHMRFIASTGTYDEERGYAGYLIFPVLSLFRNMDGVQFEGKVFEDVKDSIFRKKKGIKVTDIITHYVDVEEHDHKKQQERIERYAKICQKAMKDDQKNPQYPYELGHIYKVQGNFEKAIPLFLKTKELGKYKQPEAELGDIYFRQGKMLEALDLYEEALRKYPAYIPTYLQLGIIYTKRKRFKDAVEVYKKALERDPKNQVAYQNLSATLLQAQNIMGAMKILDLAYKETKLEKFKTILEDLKNKLEKNEKIKNLLKEGKTEEAGQLLKNDVAQNPESILALTNLGAFYFGQKQYEKVVDLLSPVLEKNTSTANHILNMYNNVATAYTHLDDTKSAIKVLKQALKLNPPNQEFFEKRIEEIKEK